MAASDTTPVRQAGDELLAALLPTTGAAAALRVLGVRPHRVTAGVCTCQLPGDYPVHPPDPVLNAHH